MSIGYQSVSQQDSVSQQELVSLPWHQKAKNEVDTFKELVVSKLGVEHLNAFQGKMDRAGASFEETMGRCAEKAKENIAALAESSIDAISAKFPKLSTALSDWSRTQPLSYKIAHSLGKLAILLTTLPLKAARNIANLLYQTLKAIAYGVVHPIEGAAKLAKLLISMAHAMTKPETWTMMGAGMVGAGLGQMALGNVFAPIATIVGAAIMALGLSVGAIIQAIQKEGYNTRTEAALDYLLQQGKQIPEAMMTGFLMGLLIGAIQKSVVKKPQLTEAEASKLARKSVPKDLSHVGMSNVKTDGITIHAKWSGYPFNDHYWRLQYGSVSLQNPAVAVQAKATLAVNTVLAGTADPLAS